MAKKNLIINKVEYADVYKVNLPLADGSGDASYLETSDADAAAGEILAGKSGYVNGAKIVGTMPDNGAVGGDISTVAGKVTVPAGYTTGGDVQIAEAEQAKIVPGNIKAGTTILGVDGKSSVVDTEDADATAGEILAGKTAYVNGAKVTGTTTLPTITLTDGVLSIS